jgi:hypothetical protein
MALDAHAAEVAPLFEHCSAHEDADADEQEQHDDDEQCHGVVLRRQRRESHKRAPVKEERAARKPPPSPPLRGEKGENPAQRVDVSTPAAAV